MGRRIVIKKIQNITRCQVTFSKRRTSLINRMTELALSCGVDVAFIAFSPAGRVTKFCSRRRLEELIILYANLPAHQRLEHFSDLEEKLEKLQQLSHIYGEISKLQYLDKQIENLELQIQRGVLQLQVVEANVRDYEIGQDQDPASLHQISWCERNLQQSLEKVIARRELLLQKGKIELQKQPQALHQSTLNHFNGNILMKLDPWISPFSAKVRETIIQGLIDQGKRKRNGNPGPSNSSNFPIRFNLSNIQSSSMFGSEMIMSHAQVPPSYIPIEQSLRVDNQPRLNFHHDQNIARNNNSSVLFSDATHMSASSLYKTQDLRFTTSMVSNPSKVDMFRSLCDEMGTAFQCSNPNMINKLSNMENQQNSGKPNMDHHGGFIVNGNPRNDNELLEDYCRMIKRGETHRNNQSQDVSIVHPPCEASNRGRYGGPSIEATNGDNSVWAAWAQRNGSLDWEDWLLNDS